MGKVSDRIRELIERQITDRGTVVRYDADKVYESLAKSLIVDMEIAYGIVPTYEGQRFATEVARALISHAVESGQVRIIRAHTLPEVNASTNVLEKCGFVCL